MVSRSEMIMIGRSRRWDPPAAQTGLILQGAGNIMVYKLEMIIKDRSRR